MPKMGVHRPPGARNGRGRWGSCLRSHRTLNHTEGMPVRRMDKEDADREDKQQNAHLDRDRHRIERRSPPAHHTLLLAFEFFALGD